MWYAVAVRALRGLVRGARVPGGVIAQDFDLRGILTANKLSKFRVSEQEGGAAGTIRAERARARGGPVRRRERLAQRHRAWHDPFVPQAVHYPRSGVRPVYLSGNMTKCRE